METFSLRKVIDPRTHMPEKVQEAHHEIMMDWQQGNDSFNFWTVGRHDYDEEDDPFLFTLTQWLNANFETGEELIILNWW
jgi:hypothetical protein